MYYQYNNHIHFLSIFSIIRGYVTACSSGTFCEVTWDMTTQPCHSVQTQGRPFCSAMLCTLAIWSEMCWMTLFSNGQTNSLGCFFKAAFHCPILTESDGWQSDRCSTGWNLPWLFWPDLFDPTAWLSCQISQWWKSTHDHLTEWDMSDYRWSPLIVTFPWCKFYHWPDMTSDFPADPPICQAM